MHIKKFASQTPAGRSERKDVPCMMFPYTVNWQAVRWGVASEKKKGKQRQMELGWSNGVAAAKLVYDSFVHFIVFSTFCFVNFTPFDFWKGLSGWKVEQTSLRAERRRPIVWCGLMGSMLTSKSHWLWYACELLCFVYSAQENAPCLPCPCLRRPRCDASALRASPMKFSWGHVQLICCLIALSSKWLFANKRTSFGSRKPSSAGPK